MLTWIIVGIVISLQILILGAIKGSRTYAEIKELVPSFFRKDDKIETKDLRTRLANKGIFVRLVFFHHYMWMLEQEGCLVHWDESLYIDNQLVKQRWYSLTAVAYNKMQHL